MNHNKVHIKVIKINKKRMTFLFVCLAILLYLTLFGGYREFLKPLYPQKYKDLVVTYSNQMGLDKNLVYALIKAESNFKKDATSPVGAIGLMQIMHETSKECSRELGERELSKEELYDPETNIKLGTYYLKKMLNTYDDLALALAAYNSGPGTVNKWMRDIRYYTPNEGLKNIPFKETNAYVRTVKRNYEIYKKLYGG